MDRFVEIRSFYVALIAGNTDFTWTVRGIDCFAHCWFAGAGTEVIGKLYVWRIHTKELIVCALYGKHIGAGCSTGGCTGAVCGFKGGSHTQVLVAGI